VSGELEFEAEEESEAKRAWMRAALVSRDSEGSDATSLTCCCRVLLLLLLEGLGEEEGEEPDIGKEGDFDAQGVKW